MDHVERAWLRTTIALALLASVGMASPSASAGGADASGLLLGLRAPAEPIQLNEFKGYSGTSANAGAGISYRAELVAGGVSALIPLNPRLTFAADLGGSLDLNGLPVASTALMNAAPLRLGPAAVTAYGASARYSLSDNWTTIFGIQHRAFEYGNGVTPLNNDGNISTGVPSTERRFVFELRRDF